MISEIICFLYLLIPMWFTPRANQIYTFMRSTIFFRAKDTFDTFWDDVRLINNKFPGNINQLFRIQSHLQLESPTDPTPSFI